MKTRKSTTIKAYGYTMKTYADNNETIVSKNGVFCCILPTLNIALKTFNGNDYLPNSKHN